MTSQFDNLFQNTGFPVLRQFHGETIRYVARGQSETREIQAVVDREPHEVVDINGNVVLPRFIITVEDCDKRGIAATEFNTGGDKVDVKNHPKDETWERVTVLKLENQNAGTVDLVLM